MTSASESRRARLVALRRRVLAPLHDARAGLWAVQELRRLRNDLPRDGLRSTVRRPPRRVSRKSGQVVLFAARLGRASCLERSLLRQAWLRRRGKLHDVVIGVRSQDEFEAHAWLDGDPDGGHYVELHRIRADSDHA